MQSLQPGEIEEQNEDKERAKEIKIISKAHFPKQSNYMQDIISALLIIHVTCHKLINITSDMVKFSQMRKLLPG